MATSVGPTPVGTTPLGLTPAGTTPESERDDEFQEHEKILSPDFLSVAQITDLLTEDVAGVQAKLGMFLKFKNVQTCLKDAIILDYYVSGFLWARGMEFSTVQHSKFMTLLDMLLQNLKTLRMSLEDNLKWLGEVMAEIGPTHLEKNEEWNLFDVKQANAIIDYLQISLFQHYKLYEFMFYFTREEIVIGTEAEWTVRERETERKVFLCHWFTLQWRCGRHTALIRRQKPGAYPGLPWGAGPKDLGHPPLHSWAIAESWPGRGATGTESGAPTGTRTRCAGTARRRISLWSHGASCFPFTLVHMS
ncbi:ciliary-associated calcium-binding coiled-coil protein 1 isoform X1 [Oryctolagus cuniculus]|uniref:ciliary-associated calcium-binding coiled-coil protein 1 isoform X1 n=1 Tax=Oryctolagus cuniculus TaxID=9986 RepID=UPI0038790282